MMGLVGGEARHYATALLASMGLGRDIGRGLDELADHDPVTDWHDSGGQELTGDAAGPGLTHVGAATALRGTLMALAALQGAAGGSGQLPGLGVISDRARLMGLRRQGAISCGGGTRLLATKDTPVAVTLSRPDDWTLLAAALRDPDATTWAHVVDWAARHASQHVRDRFSLLGLAVAIVGETAPTPGAGAPWHLWEPPGVTATRHRTGSPRVVNLASLWAGPLSASILAALGCDVVQLEDPRRPDPTRTTCPDLHQELSRGIKHQWLELDLDALRSQLSDADVVIEGSRPRALRQLGITAEDYVERGAIWVSITGHGRNSERIGYGDDTAAAGGLVKHGCFVSDAIADPLTGLHAAVAAYGLLHAGRPALVDLPLSQVAAAAAGLDTLSSVVSGRRGSGC